MNHTDGKFFGGGGCGGGPRFIAEATGLTAVVSILLPLAFGFCLFRFRVAASSACKVSPDPPPPLLPPPLLFGDRSGGDGDVALAVGSFGGDRFVATPKREKNIHINIFLNISKTKKN